MKRITVLAGLIVLFFCSAVLSWGFVRSVKAGSIAGIVDCEGRPLTDIQVSISGNKVKSDLNGKFFISAIPPGAHIVAFTGEKCIKSFFKPVLVWPDSTTILILSADTLPRPALNCKVKEIMEIDSASFSKMYLEDVMKFVLSPEKREVLPDSAKKIIINGDTVMQIRFRSYPQGPVELASKQMKIAPRKKVAAGNIAGIVFDISTMEPIAGATVFAEDSQIIMGTKTDTLGRFWLSSVPVREYTLRAGKIYYYTSVVSAVKVANDSTSIVLFRLVYTSIPERPWPYPWQESKIKCDSIEFYNDYWETLLRKK